MVQVSRISVVKENRKIAHSSSGYVSSSHCAATASLDATAMVSYQLVESPAADIQIGEGLTYQE